MKVIKENKKVAFEDIPVGGVFGKSDTDVCIKTESFYDEFNCEGNAINLSDGTFYYYYCDSDDEVFYYPNAVLNLGGK